MKVIILNGPMGVGKTTVGKYIAEHNPGTAFIDGDWCMDIHPFVGNNETRAMAVDNILYMIGNYQKCSECSMVVLVWLMDDPNVVKQISDGIKNLNAQPMLYTLICGQEELIRRWEKDTQCEWRTDEWLNISLKSFSSFVSMENIIDTDGLSVEHIAEMISDHML